MKFILEHLGTIATIVGILATVIGIPGVIFAAIKYYFLFKTSVTEMSNNYAEMKEQSEKNMELFKKANMATNPATKLNIPKSTMPNSFNTTLVVYNEMNIVIAILKYRKPVFFTTLFRFDNFIYLKIFSKVSLKLYLAHLIFLFHHNIRSHSHNRSHSRNRSHNCSFCCNPHHLE